MQPIGNRCILPTDTSKKPPNSLQKPPTASHFSQRLLQLLIYTVVPLIQTFQVDAMDSNVSTEELRSYHSIDRDLYTRLVVQLRRDPAQSLRIMAFWLLLEQLGCPSISFAVRTMSNTAVDALFEEALAILHCMQSKTQPSRRNGAIAKTHHLTNKKITLQYVHERRVDILNGITIIISQVCARVLEDIIEETGRSQESVAQILGMSIRLDECSAGGDQARPTQLKMPILPFIPHASHPAFHPSHRFEVGESSNAKTAEPPHDRTMFMTFSRGYPISEDELRAHLIRSVSKFFFP